MYFRLIWVQIRGQLQYRAAFLLESSALGMSLFLFFIAFALVLQRFGGIGGWQLPEIAFLWGLVEFSFGTMDLIFSGFDPRGFGQLVRRGRLDQMLLRPVNITMQVFASQFFMRRAGRMTQGAAILVFGIIIADISWTAAKIAYLPVVILSLIAFFGGIFILGATLSFWTIEAIEVVNIFTYGGNEMMTYPMHIYPDLLRRFFTYIVPAIFVSYYPAIWFLDKPDPLGGPAFAPFLAPVAGGLMMLVGLLFWQYGLKHYQSTGT